jgi:ClpP class serine protease
VVKTLTLELLRDVWLMHEPSVEIYATAAAEYLTGKEVSTGFFSSLKLPDVPNNVALIPVVGALTKADVCAWQGTRSLTMLLNEAAKDNSKDSIILLFENCPGGQVDGTQEFGNAVIAAKKRKPVLGAVSGMCASAGVWINSQTTESYATTSTDFIGCIGVLGRMRNPAKAKEDNKDYVEVISDFSPDKNSESKSIDAYKAQMINPLAKIFHDNVKSGRGDKLKLEKENVLSGKTYIAQDAVDYGLIDGILSFDKIVKRSIMLAKSIK